MSDNEDTGLWSRFELTIRDLPARNAYYANVCGDVPIDELHASRVWHELPEEVKNKWRSIAHAVNLASPTPVYGEFHLHNNAIRMAHPLVYQFRSDSSPESIQEALYLLGQWLKKHTARRR